MVLVSFDFALPNPVPATVPLRKSQLRTGPRFSGTPPPPLRVGYRVKSSGLRVWGLGKGVGFIFLCQGLGFGVECFGFRVSGLGFRV
jgi:hypothetical protein